MAVSPPLLELRDVHAYYGESHVLQGVSFSVNEGSVVSLLGRNGAGKTTTLKAIMRILPPRGGEVLFDGKPLAGLPLHKVAQLGIAYVQETRAIFPSLTVRENLNIAQRAGSGAGRWTLDRVFDEFPVLRKKAGIGGTQLSGGEQQMLAIARGLVSNPRLLLLDEPSEGLAPLIVQEIGRMIAFLKAERATILLVEQNFAFVTELADDNVVLGKGLVRWRGSGAALRGAADIMQAWLGVAA